MGTMAEKGQIFDGTSAKLSSDVGRWRKGKTSKDVLLDERHMINAGKSTSVYHCYDLEDESLDKSGFATFAHKSFCTRENYSSNKEECLRVKTRPGQRTWPLHYDEKKICVVVHNVDHTDEDDRKPVLVTFVNDAIAKNPALIEDGLGIDFSTDINTAVKIETNHGGISYYTHAIFHLLQVPKSSSRFYGGHNLEGLQRTMFGLLVEAGYQAKTRAHRGKVYEPLHSRILEHMIAPWEDNIDDNLAEHVKKFAESETGIHGRGMLVTPDEETPSALEEVGWYIYPALSSWKWEFKVSKPAADVVDEEVVESKDEEDVDVKISKDQGTDLLALTPALLDMHFGQGCKDMKCKDTPRMIKLPANMQTQKDDGLNGGFTRGEYWRDLFNAEFAMNNPKASIGKKECIQALTDLNDHVTGIYSTHGDPYTDTVYTMIDDNVLFFKVCKPILEKEEKSELKLEHSDMESYLREVHGYETYHSFLDMKYMKKENEDCQVSLVQVHSAFWPAFASYPMWGEGHRVPYSLSELATQFKRACELAYSIAFINALKNAKTVPISLSSLPKVSRKMFGNVLPAFGFRLFCLKNVHLTPGVATFLAKAWMIPLEWGIQVLRHNTLKTEYVSTHDRSRKGKKAQKDMYLRERLQNMFTILYQDETYFANFAVYVCNSLNSKALQWIESLEKYQFGEGIMKFIKKACMKKNN